jgi:anti-sigma factor RsiW
MHPSRLSPDDPRLTAYALGELDPAEAAAVAAAVRADPALEAEVEAIRRCGADLTAALATEPLPIAVPMTPPRPRPRLPARRWNPFPQLYYVAGGLAAAGVAVLVALNRDEILERERQRTENRRELAARAVAPATSIVAIDLAPAAATATTAGEAALTFAAAGTVTSAEALVLAPEFGAAAFTAVRDHLAAGRLPPRDAVRPAEFINAFRYRRPPPPPADGSPVAAALELGDAPWAPDRRLVRIGLQGRDALLAEAREGVVAGLARSRAGVARDVRIQVEFNPARVAGYRLVGRERDASARTAPIEELATAPELAAGQAFTALYEIVPAAPSVVDARAGELLTVRLQFVAPAGGPPRTLEFSLAGREVGSAPDPSADFQLAAAAAEFAQVLRQGPTRAEAATLRRIEERAAAAAAPGAPELDGNRGAELLQLVRRAQALLE